MRIVCGKCQAVYELDKNLIPQQGRKVRCSSCGDIFVCYPEMETSGDENVDVYQNVKEEFKVNEEVIKEKESEVAEQQSVEEKTENTNVVSQEETTEHSENVDDNAKESVDAADDDMKDIFQRLSEQTEELFQQEQQMSKIKVLGVKIKHFLGLQNKNFRRGIIFSVLVVVLLSFYYFRYPLTRKFPIMEHVYGLFNIKSVVPGEGLEFQNVTRREFEDDYVNKIEVKGYIANNTERKIKVPTIRLDTLDKDARVLHEQYEKAPVEVLDGNGKIAFSIIVTKPSPLSKYVYLTFVDDDKK